MRYGSEPRLETLERRLELLAAMLGKTCEDLDGTWLGFQAAKICDKADTAPDVLLASVSSPTKVSR